MLIDSQEISINNWVMRVHRPDGNGPFPLVLMLHGWTGDEKSMWVFASRLPKGALLVAPRGIYPDTIMGGFSWFTDRSKPWPWVSDFIPSVETVYNFLNKSYFPDAELDRVHLVGFSQGAALAYSMTMMHPEKIASLAGLSGFLPDGSSDWLSVGRLEGLPIFIAHGTQDTLVPVERARTSVSSLEKAGAMVTYCEDDVEHKLSAKCFRGLEAFYEHVEC